MVDAAIAGGPQAVPRRGKPAVVVVGAEDWARIKGAARTAGFAAHLAAIPRGGEDGADPLARAPLAARDVDLGAVRLIDTE